MRISYKLTGKIDEAVASKILDSALHDRDNCNLRGLQDLARDSLIVTISAMAAIQMKVGDTSDISGPLIRINANLEDVK